MATAILPVTKAARRLKTGDSTNPNFTQVWRNSRLKSLKSVKQWPSNFGDNRFRWKQMIIIKYRDSIIRQSVWRDSTLTATDYINEHYSICISLGSLTVKGADQMIHFVGLMVVFETAKIVASVQLIISINMRGRSMKCLGKLSGRLGNSDHILGGHRYTHSLSNQWRRWRMVVRTVGVEGKCWSVLDNYWLIANEMR